MLLIDKKSAIRIFYYLMAVDDTIESVETDQLESIGLELDPEGFPLYKEPLFRECENAVTVADGEELYDIILEHVDDALNNTVDSTEDGVPSRMILWDMLVMSMADGEYEAIEKRLIAHVARKCNIEQSVFLEMEQLIKTSSAVDRELEMLSSSTLPYSEIRPIADEAERRRSNISRCVTELIADELLAPIEAMEVREDFVDKAKRASDPLLQQAGAKASQLFNVAKEKSAPVADNVSKAFGDALDKSAPAVDSARKQLGKAFGGLKAKFVKQSNGSEQKEEN